MLRPFQAKIRFNSLARKHRIEADKISFKEYLALVEHISAAVQDEQPDADHIELATEYAFRLLYLYCSFENAKAYLEAFKHQVKTDKPVSDAYRATLPLKNNFELYITEWIDILDATRNPDVDKDILLLLASRLDFVNVDLMSSDGATLASSAVYFGYNEILDKAIEAGANIHMRLYNTYNISLLHIAARRNNPEAARTLIKQGLDINAVDAYGRTALDLAVQAGHEEMISLLETYNGTGKLVVKKQPQRKTRRQTKKPVHVEPSQPMPAPSIFGKFTSAISSLLGPSEDATILSQDGQRPQ